MVVFCCGECGEAMKKAQVDAHYQRRCRSCNIVSCLDCGKDFWGKEYEQHTKCISEEEKYSGKNYVAKPNANKGEVKQQNWIQQVQDAIDKVKTNPRLKNILERMKEYPNIPRKKAKFENFLKNSLRVNDKNLAAQIWDLLMSNTEKPKQPEQASTNTQNGNSKENTTAAQQQCSERLENNSEEIGTKDGPVKPLSKREKKEERRKKANKAEKKDKTVNGSGECSGDGEVRKKSKKRKRREEEKEEEEVEEEESPEKRIKQEEGSGDEEEEEEAQKKVFKTKFKWNDVIVQLLQAKGEMKLKKLRRKVVSEYLAQGCTAKSEEKLWAKFDSKLKRNPAVKVLHDRAKLVQ